MHLTLVRQRASDVTASASLDLLGCPPPSTIGSQMTPRIPGLAWFVLLATGRYSEPDALLKCANIRFVEA
jgi:hypothetical protein